MLNENKPAASPLGLEIFQKSAWLLSQEVSDLLLAFVFTFVALRRLGPENFGLLTLTQAILNLSGLASFNLELALIRMVPEARGLGRWRQARWMIGISELVKGSLALFVAGILFLAAPLIGNFFEQPVLVLTIRIGCLSLVSAAVADAGAAACLSLLHPEMRALVTTIRRSLEVTGLILITTWRTQVGDVILVLALADLSAALRIQPGNNPLFAARSNFPGTAGCQEHLETDVELCFPPVWRPFDRNWRQRTGEIISRQAGKRYGGWLLQYRQAGSRKIDDVNEPGAAGGGACDISAKAE